MSKERKSLGESLVEKGIINAKQLSQAEKESLKNHDPLRKTLIKMGVVKEEDIIAFFEKQLNIPHVNLNNYIIDKNLFPLISEDFARKHGIIPLFKTRDMMIVATVDPLNVIAIDDIREKTKCIIEPVVANENEIMKIISQNYGAQTSIEEVVKVMGRDEIAEETKEEALSLERMRQAAEQAPVIKLVNLILTDALKASASDIHINPDENILRIRYRIDGILHEVQTIPKNLQAAIISRVKIMSDLNIAVKRSPQDGRFRIHLDSRYVDFRVSAFPSIHGENIVMRILDPKSVMINMEKLGFYPENLEQFKSLLEKPYGIFLVTGPTGSGKTTTLYSALSYVNSPDKNIITLEDPVEYQLPYIRQAQINPKAGLTFATGLRSILRQDPDIIMVGEIRDRETAEIAIQSALTGHLVFSTLHTNDASGALTRLIDMGIEPFLVSSSTIGILAQRLVRKICSDCKIEFMPSEKILADFGLSSSRDKKTFYKGKGCSTCKNTGYKGRIGIYELIIMNEKIRELVMLKSSPDLIRKTAIGSGMMTLHEDGIKKVFDGITTLEEVIRVTKTD